MRRRVASSLTMALAAGLLLASVTAAAKPSTGCPSTASSDNRARTYFIVDIEEWWARTVDGFAAEGIQVYVGGGYSGTYTEQFEEFATSAGFDGGAGLEDFVRVAQWDGIDKNGNDLVCMKERPVTPGNPAYFFNGVDDQSSSPNG